MTARGEEAPVDLSFVAELAATPGPYATAYLEVSRDRENAPHEIELRWRELRDALSEQGADGDTLDALGEAVRADPPVPGSAGRCLVGRAGRVRFDRPMPAPPRAPGASWQSLPHLWPYLAELPRLVPYVVAVVDRQGADVYAVEQAPDGLARTVADRTVSGGDRPISKVAAGGWSQRRYQQRAENLWEANARQVADSVDHLVGEVGAALLAVVGEPRARADLLAALPARSKEVAAETTAGGRALGASDDALEAGLAELVDECYTRHLAERVDAFQRQSGRHDGLAGTTAALRERRVAALLVRDDPRADRRRLYVGPEPDQVAVDPAHLTALGVDPEAQPAEDALVRAAAATDARLTVLAADRSEPDLTAPAEPDAPDLELADGVGYLARY